MTTETTSSNEFELKLAPTFGIYKEIPEWAPKQLDRAVWDFIDSSGIPNGVDVNGVYQGTLEAITGATYLSSGGEFWLGHLNQEVLIYVIAHITRDIDNKLTYHVSQAWVRKDYRGKPIVKEWWNKIRARAKNLMCSHIMVTSTRGVESYCKFLGKGWHLYAHLLKEDIL